MKDSSNFFFSFFFLHNGKAAPPSNLSYHTLPGLVLQSQLFTRMPAQLQCRLVFFLIQWRSALEVPLHEGPFLPSHIAQIFGC